MQKGDDRVEEKLIRDKLGSPVEGQIQTENGDFAVMSLEGEIVTDVDFSQTKMLRDKLGSPIPQRWSTEVNGYVAVTTENMGTGGGGDGGPVTWSGIIGKPSEFPPIPHTHTIDDIDGLRDELNQVFTQVSSGKLSLETAIETKGVKVNKSSDIATFDELRMAILAIVTGSGDSNGNDLRMSIKDIIKLDFQQPTATNPTEYINYPITNVADNVTVTLQEV